MAGVHGLQHVEGFLAAALAEDDAVGPHAQRVLDQLALADFALAFDVGRPRLHAADMRLLQLQFGGVLDGDRRSLSEMKADSALSIVVLPEPVPPEMIVVMRAFTAAASTSRHLRA